MTFPNCYTILFLAICQYLSLATLNTEPLNSVSAATWHVSPTGDDESSGSIDAPFASIKRAQEVVSPGDTVLIRGGIYRMDTGVRMLRVRHIAAITRLDRSGEPGRPITYRNYPNEQPVFDCSAFQPVGKRVDAFYVTGSWIQLVGLEVTGVQVTMKGHTQSICFHNEGSHNVYERLSMHDGQAIGIYTVGGSDNLFLNCDAWNNWDFTSENGKGGNVDGFGGHPTPGSAGNVFRGCRAWLNSDDGFDCINASESITFENCWAFQNGYSADGERLADGNGFKIGGFASTPAHRLPSPIPRHTIRNCIAYRNKNSGFYANHHPGGNDWFSNTAYKNGINFNMLGRLADNRTDVDGYGHRLEKNLSYQSKRLISNLNFDLSQLSNNSFENQVTLQDSDFVSLNTDELKAARDSNGNLPAIRFLRPVEGSPLTGMGADTEPSVLRQ